MNQTGRPTSKQTSARSNDAFCKTPTTLYSKTKIILSLSQTSMGYILLDVKQSHTPIMQRSVLFVICLTGSARNPACETAIAPYTLIIPSIQPLLYCSFCATCFYYAIFGFLRWHSNWLPSRFCCQADNLSKHQVPRISSQVFHVGCF